MAQMRDYFLRENFTVEIEKKKVLHRNNKVHKAVSGVYLNMHDTLHSFVSSLLL